MIDGPDVVIISEPELVLPSDPIPGPVLAFGEAVGGERQFPTIDALVAYRDQIETEKNAGLPDWRARIGHDQWVWRRIHVTVYGHVLGPAEVTRLEAAHASPPAAIQGLLERLANARARGWVYGRWFSSATPEGEWGCTHVADLDGLLTDEEAAAAADADWPDRERP